jgi:carbamoyltransferase
VSVDGFGDFASAAWGSGHGNSLSLDGRVLFPHSLGIFYQAMTQYLGFPHYGDEYKLMGLAAYGNPSCRPEVEKLLSIHKDGSFTLELNYFRHHTEDIAYEWPGGEPVCGPLFSQTLVDALGPARSPDAPIEDRHRNLAFATQAVYEDSFFNLLNTLQRRDGHTAVALAGGCAYNSVANGKIKDRTAFTKCYLQSAAGDAGGAIGAAYAVWHRTGARTAEMTHAFWGHRSPTPNWLRCWWSDIRTSRPKTAPYVRSIRRKNSSRRQPVPSPTVLWSAGSRAAWNGGRGHSAIAQSLATRDAPI